MAKEARTEALIYSGAGRKLIFALAVLLTGFAVVLPNSTPIAQAVDTANFHARLTNGEAGMHYTFSRIHTATVVTTTPVDVTDPSSINLSLPDGVTKLVLTPTFNEITSVAPVNYKITVLSGIVTSVERISYPTYSLASRKSISPQAGIYPLTFDLANIVGTLSDENGAIPGTIQKIVLSDFGEDQYDLPVGPSGKYAISVPLGNLSIVGYSSDERYGTTSNCFSEAGKVKTCNIKVPATNFKFQTFDLNGHADTQVIQAWIDSVDQSGPNLHFQVTKSVDGIYSLGLPDDQYSLWLWPSAQSQLYGKARAFNFTISHGALINPNYGEGSSETVSARGNIFLLKLKQPNFTARIIANGAPDPWAYFWSNGVEDGSGDKDNSDSSGIISLNLTSRTTKLFIAPGGNETSPVVGQTFTIIYESNVVKSIANQYGDTVPVHSGVIDLTFAPPNVRGTLTSGSEVLRGPFYVWQDQAEIWNNGSNAQFSDGSFGMVLDTGTYTLVASTPHGGFKWSCSVTTSRENLCSHSITAPRVNFQLLSPDGTPLNSRGQISINASSGRPGTWSNLQLNSIGKGYAYIEDGDYSVNISNGRDLPGLYGLPRNFELTVASGVITRFVDAQTSENVNIVDGEYKLNTIKPNLRIPTEPSWKSMTGIQEIAVAGTENYSVGWNSVKSQQYSIDGAIYANLDPGTYSMFIGPGRNSLVGRINTCSINADTLTTCDYEVPTANAFFVVKNQSGNVVRNPILNITSSIYMKSLIQNYNATSAAGQISLGFWNGTFRVTVSSYEPSVDGTSKAYEFVVLNGVVETITSLSDGEIVRINAGKFELSLGKPNLVGSFNLVGKTLNSAYVYSLFNTQTGTSIDINPPLNVGQDGKFAFHVAPGKYRIPFNFYQTEDSGWRSVISDECEVLGETSTTCNVTVGAPNLRVVGIDGLGNPMGSQIQVCAFSKLQAIQSKYGSYSCSAPGNLSTSADLFLRDGEYEVNLGSSTEDDSKGTTSYFNVKVQNGVVVQFASQISGLEITPINGVYTLHLLGNNVGGSVSTEDGNIPVPNSQVNINGPSGRGVLTNSSGRFSTNVSPDGKYSVQAFPPYGDVNHGSSGKQELTITNGVGSLDLNLKLRTPNLKGVVRGTNGVSRNNWLNILQVSGADKSLNGNWAAWAQTNSQGNYGVTLEPGVYRIQTSADPVAGGGITSSKNCEVFSTGISTCNVDLVSFNTLLKVLPPGGGTWAGKQCSNINFGFSSSKNGTYPAQTWSYSNIDSYGNSAAALPDGLWNGSISACGASGTPDLKFLVDVTGGVVTGVYKTNGTPFEKDSNNRWTLTFDTANLSGTIKFNGQKVNFWNWINVLSLDDKKYYYAANGSTSSGNYGFIVPPGKYRIEVSPDASSNSEVAFTRLEECVVPETGTVQCDVNLASPNLKGNVVTPSGVAYMSPQIYIYRIDTYGNMEWMPSFTNAGNFSTNLPNGNFRVYVNPSYNSNERYTPRIYSVSVETGTVTSVMDQRTGTAVTAQSGRYPFALGTATIFGKVLMPDTSTVVVLKSWIQVYDSQGKVLDEYSVRTNDDGEYSLNLPDGEYFLVARSNGSGADYKDSLKVRVVISGPRLEPLDIHLARPNIYGRIVSPLDPSLPVANVSINGWIGGSYFYAYTDSDGRFGGQVETNTSMCPGSCSMYLYPNQSSDYTARNVPLNSVGNLGDIAIGAVTSRLTVRVPNGSTYLPNSYSYVNVTKLDSSGNYLSSIGVSTNDQGIAPLSLEAGGKYAITAYPSGIYQSDFAPKVLNISAFNQSTDSSLAITFDPPNVRFTVTDRHSRPNAYGWYALQRKDGSGNYQTVSKGYLSALGTTSMTLGDGNYQVYLYPGKISGVEYVDTFTVTAGIVTGPHVGANGLQVALPGGNVSGVVADSSSVVLGNVAVTAVRNDDPTKFVATSTDSSGYYELNLDFNYSWTIKALNPVSLYSGSVAENSRTPSNATVLNANISLTTAPVTP